MGNLDSTTPCPLPATGYLRLYQIIGRPARNGQPAVPALIPVSRSTWWAGVKSGRYPQPVRSLGPNITVWRVEDIRALLHSGTSDPRP
ncbi:transcriptional regulator [Pseudoxanthomonas suwonensis]|uniref:Transcriptional regulator n=1 Tax=Pseudoxanthomonas suwonensis TaxID=314722 RepID=A0A0E3Z2N6_9GAMM|nr:transcriptional regulator [Pseudoxanthomonas suwonensis]